MVLNKGMSKNKVYKVYFIVQTMEIRRNFNTGHVYLLQVFTYSKCGNTVQTKYSMSV